MSRPDLPPPSPALLARVETMRKVRTRQPRREVLWVAAVSVVAMAVVLVVFGPRGDVATWPVVVASVVCAVGFAIELWWALVPPRGQVLPLRPAAGLRVVGGWLLLCGALLAAGHEWVVEPAGLFMARARPCMLLGCAVAVVPMALCLILLRRALGMGGWRWAVLVGGAGGALAGVLLELHCPNVHVGHVVVAHGGALALPAVVLALAVAVRR
jgi:hypothetical protein